MQIIRGLSQSPPFEAGCVATIGNFDGVHLGHQRVIQNLAAHGQRLGLPVVVMLFEPQPLEYFRPEQAPPRLTNLREKIARFKTLPVDAVMLIRFNETFANAEADCFVEHYLMRYLRVQHFVVGDDFRFGKQRRGDFTLLQQAGQRAGFTVEDTRSFCLRGQRVSSTGIRTALQTGDLAQAEQLLGRPYAMCGRITHGDKRGRQMGFPTANIRLARANLPIQGVFAVTMSGIYQQPLQGIANLGVRPTAGGGTRAWLETHLFDFCGDLYGRSVEVHFHTKIRDEQKFDSLEALTAQIHGDVAAVRALLVRAVE